MWGSQHAEACGGQRLGATLSSVGSSLGGSPEKALLLPDQAGTARLKAVFPVLSGVQVGHRQGCTDLAVRWPRWYWGGGLPTGAEGTWVPFLFLSHPQKSTREE